jgi:hypothetical protein
MRVGSGFFSSHYFSKSAGLNGLILNLERLGKAFLRARSSSPGSRKTRLDNMSKVISGMKTLEVDQKVNPYLVFLFAAQNGCCQKSLIRRRSKLQKKTVLTPQCDEDILMSHSHLDLGIGKPIYFPYD